mgnify:CR=1 FL=1
MKQPVNFICTPECNINVVDQGLDVNLSSDGARQALAIGERLLSYGGEISLFSSSEAGALVGSRVIAEVAKIGVHNISSDLSKKSLTSDFEVDGEVEAIGLDEVGLTSYTALDMKRMKRFYEMVYADPFNIPTFAITDKGSIMALLGALDINSPGYDIQPGSLTSIIDISEVSTVAATRLLNTLDNEQDLPDTLAA